MAKDHCNIHIYGSRTAVMILLLMLQGKIFIKAYLAVVLTSD